jgi:hypothetical protein
MNRKSKTLGKIGRFNFEMSASVLDSMALPKVRARQEQAVRKLYHNANVVAWQTGLPTKVYHRLNSRGQREDIV